MSAGRRLDVVLTLCPQMRRFLHPSPFTPRPRTTPGEGRLCRYAARYVADPNLRFTYLTYIFRLSDHDEAKRRYVNSSRYTSFHSKMTT